MLTLKLASDLRPLERLEERELERLREELERERVDDLLLFDLEPQLDDDFFFDFEPQLDFVLLLEPFLKDLEAVVCFFRLERLADF